jgi:glycosyltransferase involved in cell wall biosynthesis
VGRLEEGKGVELLIDAVGEIISQLSALQLFIVCNGSLKPRLVEKVNDMGMGERIIFLGDKESVHDEYTTFDLLVMPSFSEGMSCVVLEAMACGLPVVATSVGGNSELMDPVDRGKTPIESGSFRIGQNGLLVNPGDTQGLGRAMRYLIEHKSRAEELGRCARKAVETHYSLENISDDYVALYRDLRR